MSLSILCVTRMEDFALKYLQQMSDLCRLLSAEFILLNDSDRHTPWASQPVQSKGYVESVLEIGVKACSGDYILRLDDDEQVTPAMAEWLYGRVYEGVDHWKFATANMWTLTHFIHMPPVWPDHHTRLSVKAKAGGRHTPHCGSPFGGGELAPVIFEHHKFVIKSFEQRKKIAATYDAYAAGYGTADNMRPFSLPETCYDELVLAPVGDGVLREYHADELEHVQLQRVAC